MLPRIDCAFFTQLRLHTVALLGAALLAHLLERAVSREAFLMKRPATISITRWQKAFDRECLLSLHALERSRTFIEPRRTASAVRFSGDSYGRFHLNGREPD